jgi:nitrite reductase/ring-hydroxylating ferredoxin subunit
MSAWYEISEAKALQPGEMTHGRAGPEDILLVNEGGAIRAYVNRCGHMNAPLDLGTFKSGVIKCAQHNAVFDARTGAVRSPPVHRSFPVDQLPPELAEGLKRTATIVARVECRPLVPLPVDVAEGTVKVYV